MFLVYASIGSDDGLAPNRLQAIILISGGLVYWCMYASLGFNELIQNWLRLWLGAD